jgi:hypothetical protein
VKLIDRDYLVVVGVLIARPAQTPLFVRNLADDARE